MPKLGATLAATPTDATSRLTFRTLPCGIESRSATPRNCCTPAIDRDRADATSWKLLSSRLISHKGLPAIVSLYDHLVSMTSSPVAVLNRAAALAEVLGPDAALAELSGISMDKR